jgi:ATP-dependent RNA helicase RhlE
MGITEPTPVQAAAIPIALTGADLIATAQTGTGKTLGYALPSLTKLARESVRHNRMLVLTPTRELAVQVEGVIRDHARALRLATALVYGGVGMTEQGQRLVKGVDVVVATPGRLLDHIGRGNASFQSLEILVLDEADRMLDMGFLPDIKRIIAKLPRERQTMMFSATFAPELERLAKDMLRSPERVTIGAVAQPVDAVRQLVVPVRQDDKSNMLLRILEEEHMDQAIVFLRTKSRTDRVAKLLKKAGHNAAPIHGDLSQSQRQKALQGFRDGTYEILVATDVAARGLDIQDISHVINYDVPENPDDYVHRIGRTARAQREGDAITFVTPADASALGAIEKTIGRNIPRKEYEGAPPLLSIFKASAAATDNNNARSGVRRPGRSLLRRR